MKSSDQKKFHFCMCNPPFFSEVHEVEFVKKMVDDSLTLKENINWFTSMVGRKSSLKPIIKYLKSKNIDKYVSTDFKQGKTMRWGIAWTFTETVIKKPVTESAKKSKPLFLQPGDVFYSANNIPCLEPNPSKSSISEIMVRISNFLTSEFNKLGIVLEEPARILLLNKIAYEVTGEAYINTWTHQRRKRREKKTGAECTTPLELDGVEMDKDVSAQFHNT